MTTSISAGRRTRPCGSSKPGSSAKPAAAATSLEGGHPEGLLWPGRLVDAGPALSPLGDRAANQSTWGTPRSIQSEDEILRQPILDLYREAQALDEQS